MLPTSRSRSLRSERGSALVEFMLTFPAFLILCLFTLEASCMWMDRHIVRLAAFEAARRIAASDQPLEGDPCGIQDNLSAGRSVAVRRIAAISPSVTYLLGVLDLGSTINVNLPDLGKSTLMRTAQRLLLRLPTAAALTSLQCSYKNDTVSVKVIYQRMPVIPIIDSLIYGVYKLSLFNQRHNSDIAFDSTFRDITAGETEDMPALRAQVIKALGTAKTTGLADTETAKLLGGIDGLHLSTLNSFSRDAESILGSTFLALPKKVQESSKTSLPSQEAILSAAMFATGLRLIPLTVTANVQRNMQGPRTDKDDPTADETWNGFIKGIAHIAPSDAWRDWARDMSKSDTYLGGGKPL